MGLHLITRWMQASPSLLIVATVSDDSVVAIGDAIDALPSMLELMAITTIVVEIAPIMY